jgi:hypothetical protein
MVYDAYESEAQIDSPKRRKYRKSGMVKSI